MSVARANSHSSSRSRYHPSRRRSGSRLSSCSPCFRLSILLALLSKLGCRSLSRSRPSSIPIYTRSPYRSRSRFPPLLAPARALLPGQPLHRDGKVQLKAAWSGRGKKASERKRAGSAVCPFEWPSLATQVSAHAGTPVSETKLQADPAACLFVAAQRIGSPSLRWFLSVTPPCGLMLLVRGTTERAGPPVLAQHNVWVCKATGQLIDRDVNGTRNMAGVLLCQIYSGGLRPGSLFEEKSQNDL
ncbi:hypothetical protein BDK51DRAFT_36806 [Blyttiomyces helicus]|uniref:Uncharacterized protein n=1 Tax=Blyttiomyces helicus TaxID=388810 RepID=A0A4V1ISC8_9FUNG|nr:hypothetical protein BDK51DRAFT_36806 [Blyttiomyces helicus]|eukprot:RKO93107.1 hypothetical protein BDK51DRAFT_36806 [Blyttiomyces helicus]